MFGLSCCLNQRKKDAKKSNPSSRLMMKYGSKSIQMSLILRQHPPKPYKLLKFSISGNRTRVLAEPFLSPSTAEAGLDKIKARI